ncbi:MAG: GTPase domain-containing protein [Pseudomonadota bacterium]|nr:GTPase domain-containing protein [Sphingomonas sp.]MDQ3479247.1 GTPase domain-containing protein [Pseudomonadota bacterium]
MSTEPPPPPAAETINLSLISHTNAGKTTLVRTLLQQDVGEVRDAAHVTEVATGYVMLQEGPHTLMLWDTPGFGDTARLVARLRSSGNPIGWFLSQVWDRFRDRPLWSSQQAVRNAREEADIILYLVNASEDPAGAAYVSLEMEVLAWVGKPIVLLLNQTGPPREDGHAEEQRWTEHLASTGLVRGTLTLDAFARCWVQERTLLHAITPLLNEQQQQAMRGLIAAWTTRNLGRFRASMRALASQLAAVACDREEIGDRKWHDRVRGAVVNPSGSDASPEAKRAMGRLGERVDQAIRESTDRLIELHGLSGRAAQEVLKRMRDDYTEAGPAREGVAAMLGGLLSGAAGGLAADAAAGGLTLGAGMIVGGILGALGAGSAAHGFNLVRGDDSNSVRWSEEFFVGLAQSALLRYLAVAHFGRGRGEWEEGEHPAHWQGAVAEEVAADRRAIHSVWSRARDTQPDAVMAPLEELLGRAAGRLLGRFYPEAADLFEPTDPLPHQPQLQEEPQGVKG